jgi:hypothetical protein
MGRKSHARRKAFLWVSLMCTLIPRAAPAQESFGGKHTLPDVPREIVLRPERVAYELERANWNPDQTNAPFLKEPELSPRHVFRRVLRFGKDTNNAFGLIWDQSKHTLYVDRNRNLDLTDDPGGVFTSTNKGLRQLFTEVTLPLRSAEGLLPAALDLRLSADEGGSWMQAQLMSRSVWQARVTLEGEDWQVAVADKLLGANGPVAAKFLLLRPWAVRTNQVSLDYPASGIVPFPERLFWLGRAFHLGRHIETGDRTPVCKLELAPEQPPLTELKLTGEFLCYAVLRATNDYTVVLRGPPGTVQVPPGVYTVSAVCLKRGPAEALRAGYPPLEINATTATNLVLGGPLTNWVTVERSGSRLQIGRQLKGADGGPYDLAQQDRANPPEFTVYYGGKKALAGRFRFG